MASFSVKWWGWGDPSKTVSMDSTPLFRDFLREKLKLDSFHRRSIIALPEVVLRRSRMNSSLLDGLRSIVGQDSFSIDDFDRLCHSMGKSYGDLVRLRSGRVPNPPDAVLYPRDESAVQDLLTFAAEHNLAVIPFGGGTSVVGGVEPYDDLRFDGTISLDLKNLNRIINMDSVSMTATVEAGILGPDLEERLDGMGFTLGHFPQSFEYSTLGGWVATRSAGQASTGYGKIEAMVESLRLIYPGGILETKEVPASASGPDLKALLIGSEGVLGVITRATLRIRLKPSSKAYGGFLFRSFGDGVQAVRLLMQKGYVPTIVRLSDQDETEASYMMSLGERQSSLKRVATKLLEVRGYPIPGSCLMILGFEGEEAVARTFMKQAASLCRSLNGVSIGSGVSRDWLKRRFDLPYLRDSLLDNGIMIDSLETASVWSKIPELHRNAKRSIADAIEEFGIKGLVMTHLSHAYSDGASLYFTFLSEQVEGKELEQWLKVKEKGIETILRSGGTLTHHHGVGSDHAKWLEEEYGSRGVQLLLALKRQLDPKGIMNPGKLFLKGG